MAVETATNISQLNPLWPQDIDQEAEGAGHIRVTKLAIIDTFPNVTATVNPTAVEFNHLVGVSGDIQSQLDLKAPLASPALTGTPIAPTAAPLSTGTQIATLDYVQGELTNGYAKLASPHFTGIPTAPTAAPGTAGTQIATVDFVNSTAFSPVLPGQAGNAGGVLTTDGANATWVKPSQNVFNYINFGGF